MKNKKKWIRISRVFCNVLHPSVTFCVKIHLVKKFASVTHCVMLREFFCEHRVYIKLFSQQRCDFVT